MGNNYNRLTVARNFTKSISLMLMFFALTFTSQSIFAQNAPNAAIVVNTTTVDGNDTANDVISYSVSVRNTGGIPLTSVSLTNTQSVALTLDSGDLNMDSILDVDEIWVYIGDYTNTAGTSVSNTFNLTSAEITTPITYTHTEAVHEDDYALATIKVLPLLVIGDLTVTEGDNPTAILPVSISAPSNEVVSIDITQTSGTAGTSDYTSNTITVTIPAGQTMTTVSIPITDDSTGEPTETFTVNGTSSSTCPATPATVTILDDDAPTLTVGSATVTEGDDVVVPVTLSNPSSEDVVVEITQTNGSAVGTDDYVATTISVTIPAGQTSVDVTIGTVEDTTNEPTETFSINGEVTAGTTSNATAVGTGTINDDDDAPTLTVGSATVTEGDDVVVPVTLSNPSSEDVVVEITQTNGSAVGTDDYVATTISVTIPAGQTSVDVTIGTVEDTTNEPTETFSINGEVTAGTTSNTTAVGTGTINDDDDAPTLTVGSATVTEGDDVVVPVTLSNPSSEDVVVEITQTNGSAVGTDDYVATTISVTIPAGSTSVDVTIGTVEDTTSEPTESFSINGSVTAGTTSNATAVGTGTINDDDDVPTIVIGDVTVTEGADMNVDAVVPVSITNPSSVDTVITITQTAGTAGTDDYVETTIEVTIPAGETSTTVTIEVQSDDIDEATETFSVNGTSPTATTATPGTVTILDDPTDVPTIVIGDVTVTEGADMNVDAVVPVSITNPSDEDTVITITQTAGTAGTDDYVETTIVVTIPAGETSTTVTIPVQSDDIDEATETFAVNGTSPTATTATPGTVTILDDPTDVPTIVIGDVTVTEGADMNVDAVVPVSITNPSDEDTVITITQTAGTAGTDDYVETTIVVTIPAGETSTTVTIPVQSDDIDEATETFAVNGTSPTATTATPGTVTILDDPTDVPTIVIGDVTVTEGADMNVDAVVPVSITNPSDEDTVITITQTAGTAGTDDYVETTIVVTIPAGETSTTVTIPVQSDDIDEATETFAVNGTSPTATTATPGTVTILDDPTDVPTIVIGDVTVTEGADMNVDAVVPVSITNPSDEDTVITITQTAGTAGTDDYVETTIVVTIPAGETSTTVTIPVQSDDIDEATETFSVNGTSPTATTATPGTVTILDDPTDVPTIVIGDVTVTEGADMNVDAVVPVSITNPSDEDTVITITQTAGTAGTDDYVETTIVVTIPAGETSTTVTIPVQSDDIDEATETFAVNGTSPTATTATPGTVTILDDPTDVPTIVIGDVTVTEGADMNVDAVVPVSITNPSDEDTVITITQTAGTAGTDDYVETTIVVTIPAGETSTTVTIPVQSDDIDEATETFAVNGTSPTATTATPGTVTILDDPTDVPTIVIGDVTVTEGADMNVDAVVPVSITNPSDEDTVITITQTAGTAGTDDYVETTIVVTIPAGETSTTVTIPVQSDDIDEATETFAVNGTSPTATTATPGTVTILDDPTDVPTIVIGDVTVTEGADMNVDAVVPVSITNPSDEDTVITITQTAGTAGTDDYVETTIVVTIPAGETSTTVTIPVQSDDIDEATETFAVNGTSPTATTATPGTVTILDDPTDVPTIVIGDVTVTEGADMNVDAVVPVSITNPSDEDTVITITQTAGTAGTDDYVETTIVVTIPAGETSTTVTIPVQSDDIDEATETFSVNGTSPTATTATPGTVTILDDPTDVPTIVIGDVTVTEGADMNVDAVVPVSITNPSDEDTVITITQTAGTAGTDDYVETTIVVTIPAGETSTTVTIPVQSDDIDEATETFAVNGTSPTATTATPGTVTILDDPTDVPTIVIGDVTVTEGADMNVDAVVPVSITNPSDEDTVITITQTAGTAGTDDYVETTIVVTIPAGETSTTVTIPVQSDDIDEATETFAVNGTSPTATTATPGTVTILDDPTDVPTIVIGDVTVTEGADMNVDAVVPVSITNPSDEDTVITITQTAGTAGTDDYVETTIVVTIPAGETSTTVTIPVQSDDIDEATETFAVNGTSPTATTATPGTVTILDDPTDVPTIVIGDVTVTEGADMNVDAVVPVSITNPSDEDTVITITQTAGTAGTDDYVETTIVVTIPAGETSTTVTIPVQSDDIDEATETFAVNGTSPTATTATPGTVTILDDPTDVPTIVIGDVTVTEGADMNVDAVVPVSITNPSDEDTVITITQTAGTAGTDDYVETTIVVTIPAGETSTTVTIPVQSDDIDEATETFAVNGTSPTATTATPGTVTILDDPTDVPTIVIGDVTVTEGADMNVDAVVPVSITNPSDEDTVITITQTAGTAGTDDYVETTIVVTIPAGETSTTVTIPVQSDDIDEATETFAVNGTSPTATTATPGTVTILDDPTDVPTIVIGDVTVTEGADMNVDAVVPVSITNPSDEDTVITITQTAGTAGTDDYVETTIVVTIPAGETSTTVTIPVQSDDIDEATETFAVNGTSPTATTATPGTVTILDDPTDVPTIVIGDVTVTEGADMNVDAVVPVSITNPSDEDTVITITQTAGTAGTDDYVETTIVVTIPAGETSTTVTIPVQSDDIDEATETFAVNGTSPTATTATPGTVTILDDPTDVPTIVIGDVTVTEGADMNVDAVVPVSITNPSDEDTVITITQTAGTAGTDDYVETTIVVTIPAGETSTTVTIPVQSDDIDEATETFAVNGTSPTATTATPGTVTILDDPTDVPTIVIGDVTVTEGADMNVDAVVPVSITNPSDEDTVITITQTAGTAGTDDYVETTIVVTIPAGETSTTVTIPVQSDDIDEATETFAVNGTSPTATTATPGTVTILDDPTDVPTIVIGDVTVTEGADMNVDAVVPVSITNPSDEDTVITITQTAGTAGTDDYVETTIVVTIPAGETSTTVTIPVQSDDIDEATETFAVNGTSPTATTATPGTVTILDDPTDVPTIVIGDVTVTEGADMNVDAVVPVSITNPSDEDTVITITQTAGTAGTDDYVETTIVVTIPAGETSTTVTIPVQSDDIDEATETFSVNGTSPTATTATPGTVTILDDPTDVPTIVIGDVTVTEGADMNVDAVVPVSITNPSDEDTVITITQTAGTAGTDDYVETTIVVTIPAGETSTTVTIPVQSDDIDEATETFSVNGTSSTATTATPGTVTILDDPTDVPTIVIGDVTVTEGADMNVDAVVPVSITNPSDEDTVITITQTAGTAGTDDYVETTIVVTIPAGETSTTVTIPVQSDDIDEATETFAVNGTSPTATTATPGTVTILDDPTDVPTIVIGDVTVTEGADMNVDAVVPVSITNPSDEDTVITITQTAGTAGTDDYVETTIEVTIPAGETSTTVTIPVQSDDIDEATETFAVNGTSPTATTATPGTVTILDDPTDVPTIVIGDVTVTEGADMNVDAVVPVSITNPSDEDTVITITQTAGTAGTDDYVETTIVVTIPAGETSTTVTIPVQSDDIDEATETFAVNGTSPTATTATPGTVTILDDPTDVPTIVIGDVTVTEGADMNVDAVVPVSITNPSDEDTVITITQTAGTAGTDDYVETTIVVTIPAGETSTTVTIPVQSDDIDEATETFSVNGTSPTATTATPGTVTILDDPTDVPTIVIGDVTVTEGADMNVDAVVPVSITNPSDEDTVITITQTAGTAGTDDYVETTIVVTIPAGETSTTVTIPVQSDDIDEATETFSVNGTSPTATTATPGTVTILDDPTDVPTIVIGDVTVTEGADMNVDAVVPVSITNPSDEDTVITITQTAGTAGTDDYVETTIVVTIPAGETSTTVTIPVQSDDIDEATETFAVNGTSPTATTATPGTVTILDDPTDVPTIVIGDVTVTEGADMNVDAVVPVSITNPSDEDTVITITQTAGTAGTDDYVETTIVVTIPAGETSTTVTIPVQSDDIDEATETFAVNGTSPTATTATPGTVTILDDPTDVPTIVIGDVTVTEGADMNVDAVVPVSITNPSDEDTVITITQTAGTAGTDDYVETTIVVTIPAGETSTTVTIPVQSDDIDEATETFAVNGTSPTATTATPGTVTILDDPTDVPTIVIGDVTVTEGADMNVDAVVPVSITNPSDEDTVITITQTAGTAGTDDYVETTIVVTIPAGETSTTVTIPVQSDDIDEATETFAVNGTSPTATTATPGTVTILDDPTDVPTIVIGDVTVTEGADMNVDAVVPVSITNPSDEDTVITITQTAGTAGTDDYVETTIVVTIPAGETSTTVTIPVQSDDIDEATETFAVNGTSPTATTATPGTVTILDDPTDVPTIVIGDVTVTEGADMNVDAVVPVSITNPSDEDTVITITQTAGTAGTDDYVETTIVVTIPAGETSTTVTIPVQSDDIDEATETFSVNGTSPTATTATPGTVTILDDPTDVPTIVIGDVTVTEGADMNVDAVVPVSITNPSDEDTVITITQTAGTAGTDDYVETTIVVTIPAGETSTTVTIPVQSDDIDEATETFAVNGTSPTATTATPGTVTILDDPTDVPTIVIGDVTVTEGADMNVDAVVPVSITNPSDEDTVITITQTAGTAGTDDYVETTIVVTIPAGETSTTVTIPVQSDDIDEATETFAVNGTSPTATTATPGTVTILDDPTDVPTIVIGDVTVTEGVDAVATVPVSLTNPSDEDVVVTIVVTSGTAGTDDYLETVITVTIPAGETTTTVDIGIVDDNIDEATETFTLNGTSDNANPNVTPGVVTINDDPSDVPTIVIGDVTVTEGVDAVVPVTLSNPSDEDVVVTITTSTGTAGTDDYIETTIVVTIPAGETMITVTISTIDDTLNEGNETFTVNGVVTSGNTSNIDPKGVVTIINNPVEVDLSVEKTVDNLTPMPNGVTEVMFTITVTNNSDYDATNVVVNEMLQSGFTFVSSTPEVGSYDEVSGLWTVGTVPANSTVTLLITVTVNDFGDGNLDYSNNVSINSTDQIDTNVGNNTATVTLDPVCLTVYNIITPNGDGKNDTLQIDCIENYPGATISIFNRWGNTVYTATDYDNQNGWDGTSNGRSTISAGDKLPAGTYYYVINLKNGSPVIKNWIQIAY